MDPITNQLIKDKTTVPEYGTLAGDLPKESLNEIGQQLKDMHHTIACESCKKLDIEAIRWVHSMLTASWQYLFGQSPRQYEKQMLDRLRAMLEVK